MIIKNIVIGFDFNARTIDKLLKMLNPFDMYPVYIQDIKGRKINTHSLLGLLSLTLHKGDNIEIAIDAPEYIANKIINIFQSDK